MTPRCIIILELLQDTDFAQWFIGHLNYLLDINAMIFDPLLLLIVRSPFAFVGFLYT